MENDSICPTFNSIFSLKDPVVGPNSGILLREHEPVPVNSYYDGSAPSATNHYFHQNKRGQIIFQPLAKAEPFNDSTAAMNLQRRSSMPLLPAKFVSRIPKSKSKSTTLHTEESERSGITRNLDENQNHVAKVLPSYSSNVVTPATVAVTMDNSTKITENLNLQKRSEKKTTLFSGKLHELSKTLQQTVKDRQIIRRSSSSFIGINSATSVSSLNTSDSESDCFHTKENTPSSVRSAPPTMLLSPISSSSGQFSPSTLSPTSPPSPTSSNSSFLSNGTLSPCGSPVQKYHNNCLKQSQVFAVNLNSYQACSKPNRHSASVISNDKSVKNGFPSSSTSKFVLLKSDSREPHSNNQSSKYHLHNSIITEGDLAPPPTTIDFQTGEIILKR